MCTTHTGIDVVLCGLVMLARTCLERVNPWHQSRDSGVVHCCYWGGGHNIIIIDR